MLDDRSPSGPRPFDSRAEELFADYLVARERGDDVDFEALCRAHPDLAGDLRRQQEVMDLADRLRAGSVARAKPAKGVAERLRELYGEDVDPGVSLGDEPKSETGPRSKLFERLRAEGPRGTRYRLLSEIGRGGMGAIIRVWDDELRRTLAMKVILGRSDQNVTKGDTPDVDPRTLGRFLERRRSRASSITPASCPCTSWASTRRGGCTSRCGL